MPEAPLVDTEAGLVPQGDGWFVVNVRDAAWLRNDHFGARTSFEAGGRLARELPDLEQHSFPEVGVTVYVLPPGRPSTMYHAESGQESFLVLRGECLLVVEGQERQLSAWDFFYCAPNTQHAFVGTGEQPCVILMVGARGPEGTILYARNETALKHRAGVEQDTSSPHEAYAPFPHWRLGRPDGWDDLPWVNA
ncbi:MAG: cupin domain-containing protein [Actinobacteria bacterium]|nr:MAG: cupin domain-containing protein [Actinomycetota bacterium]